MEILVFALFVAVAALVLWYSHYVKEERRQSLQRFAGKHGLFFSRRDPFGLLARPHELFNKGDERGCENVLWGAWQGLEVIAADYWHTESSDSTGRRKTYHRFSIALVDLELFAPHVLIQPENLLTPPRRSSNLLPPTSTGLFPVLRPQDRSPTCIQRR